MLRRAMSHVAGVAKTSLPRQVCIVGAQSRVLTKKDVSHSTSESDKWSGTTSLIHRVLTQAAQQAQVNLTHLDALIAMPSLGQSHFMEAHYHATQLGLLPNMRPQLLCQTIDCGGASPVSALLSGTRMIQSGELDCVAIVAADTVGSMSSADFLSKANAGFEQFETTPIPSPVIPHGYDRITAYQCQKYGLTRDQLRMVVCLESFHAGFHPDSVFRREKTATGAATRRPTTLEQVRKAPDVTPHISLLECARRADGAGCLILCSDEFLARKGLYRAGLPTVAGGGEASGPLWPAQANELKENHFSCQYAMDQTYANAGNLKVSDIDFFGLYDCFPICLVRALEATGLCEKGRGGQYLEEQYQRMTKAIQDDERDGTDAHVTALLADPKFFPVNTHGGLLAYGAPWEVPAMYNIVEATQQLQGQAKGRQIPDCRKALVYGNGGILSASAVAVLSQSV